MALIIRFSRIGKRGERKYRIVVKEERSKRDGKALDILGSYEKKSTGIWKDVDMKKVEYWTSKGAQVSPSVKSIL